MTSRQNEHHAPRQVKLHFDFATMTATVVISRMNRRGSYSARTYTLQDNDPSTARLGKVLSQYPSAFVKDYYTNQEGWSVYDVRR